MVTESAAGEPASSRSIAVGLDSVLPSALVGGLSAAAAFALGAIDLLDAWVGLVVALILGSSVQFFRRVTPVTAAAADRLEHGWRELARELDRARRHERPLTIIRLGPAAEAGFDPEEREQELSRHLRSIDRTWLDGETLYIVLPETDRVAGEAMLARIRRLGPNWGHGLAMAVFPEDGITTAALLSALSGRPLSGPPIALRASRAPDDRFRKAG